MIKHVFIVAISVLISYKLGKDHSEKNFDKRFYAALYEIRDESSGDYKFGWLDFLSYLNKKK